MKETLGFHRRFATDVLFAVGWESCTVYELELVCLYTYIQCLCVHILIDLGKFKSNETLESMGGLVVWVRCNYITMYILHVLNNTIYVYSYKQLSVLSCWLAKGLHSSPELCNEIW